MLHTYISIYFNIYILYERVTGSSKSFVLECCPLKRKIQNFHPWNKSNQTRKDDSISEPFPYEFYILPGADTLIVPRLEGFSSISQMVPNSQMYKVHNAHLDYFFYHLFSVPQKNSAALKYIISCEPRNPREFGSGEAKK